MPRASQAATPSDPAQPRRVQASILPFLPNRPIPDGHICSRLLSVEIPASDLPTRLEVECVGPAAAVAATFVRTYRITSGDVAGS